MKALDALLSRIEAGDPPPIPPDLRALCEQAAKAGRPMDVAAWAEQLAGDIADAEDE